MPGHYGRITAGPLLFTVADQLNLTQAQITKPSNVIQASICWPLGTRYKAKEQEFCQQKHQAWIIDDVIPPTWHIADADAWRSGLFSYWLNPDSKRRVSIDCKGVTKSRKQVALWPKVLEPWINKNYRRSTLIPLMDSRCGNTSTSVSATLKITGIAVNSIYRKSGKRGATPSIWLKSIGGIGKKSWYINGKHTYEAKQGQGVEHLLTKTGQQQIIVQDQQGNNDMVLIDVQ